MQSIRDLAQSVRHIVRPRPQLLDARRKRPRKEFHVTDGPKFRTRSVGRPLPSGHARTLLGEPGTLSVGQPFMMLKPRYLSERMKRVYRRENQA